MELIRYAHRNIKSFLKEFNLVYEAAQHTTRKLDKTELIQCARGNINSLLTQCNIVYEITPFDDVLYKDCIDEAIQRGYPVEGHPSVKTFLQEGVMYAATAGVHLPHRPTQIWIALCTSCNVFVDEVVDRFPALIPDLYRFNNRLIANERQGNGVLDAFADIVRRASEFYPSIASDLLITSTMNFVTATLLEHEMVSVKISSAAQGYPTFQRIKSGDAELYSLIVFPRDIPLNDYIQAIPEMTLFIHNVNDILSFYKEELAGETTNQVSMLAARGNKTKVQAYGEITKETVSLYKRIVKILEGSAEAREAFKKYVGGYLRFHTSLERYRMEELAL